MLPSLPYVFVIVVTIIFFATDIIHIDNVDFFINYVYDSVLYVLFTISDFTTKKNVLKETPIRKGHVAIVTGVNRHVIRGLVNSGYHVIVATLNVDGEHSIRDIEAENLLGSVEFVQLDLGCAKSVRSFVDGIRIKYPKVHLLVNNAEVGFVGFRLTVDGFESQIGVNYLGHFLLTHLLMDCLKDGGQDCGKCARIVNLSSIAHVRCCSLDFADLNSNHYYNSSMAYSKSKLAMLMFTRHLNRLLLAADAPVRAYAAHPGIVASDMMTKCPQTQLAGKLKILFKTPEEGARPVLHCCFSSELEQPGGNYISNCEEGYSTAYSKNEEKQKKLFDVTCDMLNIKRFGVQ
ncbi:polyprenol dehydrogenase-like isoform X2 [Arctopsyche grandis]|uniref:polyprenol dehydrogenase-like isoform X2 n=1 Tax=Arctopsyche grandis TaxID=121162 RepID=UPI00406D632B